MGVFCNMCALQGCRIWCVRTLGEGGARARCVLGVRLGAARRASREHMAGARPWRRLGAAATHCRRGSRCGHHGKMTVLECMQYYVQYI